MKKSLLIVPLIALIVLASYLPPLIGISIDNSNILVVFITYICTLIGLFRKEIYFKSHEIFLIIIQLVVATIAMKANLVSLTIIVLLNVFFAHYNGDNNLNYYIKVSLLLFFLILMAYYLFGFNQSHDVSMWRINSMVSRRAIGFTQVNQAMFAWFGIFIGCVLNPKVKGSAEYIILLFSSIFIYYQTKSRTGFIIILLILLFIFLFRKYLDKNVPNLMKLVLVNFPLLLLIVSIWLISQSNNATLNSLLTGRPALYKQYFDLAGITVWGNKIIENKMLDNSYLSMLLGKGIVFTGLYIITLMYLVISAKKISFRTYIVLMLFFIYGLTETMLFRFELFIPIIISLNLDSSNQKYGRIGIEGDS